ncbi:MAG: 30S ribosomal protein S5 [Patescibacteria group bacterium]|nr:30S ribosomal protein S5 [bacterium]MDZ4240787.1 30S ribosomal protein S5 [Patescibacteria group bacterium]
METKEITTESVPETKDVKVVSQDVPKNKPADVRPAFGRDVRKNMRRKPSRRSAPRSEYDQKLISLRRVARVVAGGRRFTFSASIVIGDKKGGVGVGVGKGADTALAIEKALRDAKKNMVRLSLTKTMSIPYEVSAKYASAYVYIKPAAEGRGLVAGRAVRTVLELAGVKDIVSKILSGSKNQLNNARAAVEALSEFSSSKK